MRNKPVGTYPPDWPDIALRVKEDAGWCCVRCGHPNDRESGHVLTTAHLDNDKSNCRWWNCAALCQRCHLSFQARVDFDRPWIFEHSAWAKPYIAGFYAFKYLGQDLVRSEVEQRLDELLALEANAVIGHAPLAVANA